MVMTFTDYLIFQTAEWPTILCLTTGEEAQDIQWLDCLGFLYFFTSKWSLEIFLVLTVCSCDYWRFYKICWVFFYLNFLFLLGFISKCSIVELICPVQSLFTQSYLVEMLGGIRIRHVGSHVIKKKNCEWPWVQIVKWKEIIMRNIKLKKK